MKKVKFILAILLLCGAFALLFVTRNVTCNSFDGIKANPEYKSVFNDGNSRDGVFILSVKPLN